MLAGAAVAMAVAVLVPIGINWAANKWAASEQAQSVLAVDLSILTLGTGAATLVVELRARRAARVAEAAAAAEYAAVSTRVHDVLDQPKAPPTLDEELHEVSGTLAKTVARLHEISDKAQAFEDEVRQLVEKAEAAKATANLHEEDAKKIALLLGAETEARLKADIEKMQEAHTNQVNLLKKAGNRTAWIAGILGAIVGFGGNLLATWLMS